MKVKVTPPYEGAGSFEVEGRDMGDKIYVEKDYVFFPASWCEAIPEITPEPGDIVEGEHGLPFFYDPVKTYSKVVRVLARKPKGYEEAWQAILEFCNVWDTSAPVDRKQAAYETFLRAILGVPYGRVDG